ncbi:hypothetical protein AC1031_009370 [Aphanomyces cochlioides]|nr:hypothetical protein AC1031_009370 [Aphanomyces cochlioides]
MSEPKRTVVGYIQDNVGWGFNLVVSNILFWLTGFPTVRDYGYSSENYDENGGSGVFVITLVLMVICYIVYFGRMFKFLTSKDDHKLE